MHHTVNKMQRELFAIILNELQRQARAEIKLYEFHDQDLAIRRFVQREYLVRGGPLHMELFPFFDEQGDRTDHLRMQYLDLDVLVSIASKLGYQLELNWTR